MDRVTLTGLRSNFNGSIGMSFRVLDCFSKVALLCLVGILTGCVAASTNNDLAEVSTPALSEAGAVYLPAVELADLEGKVYQLPKDFPSDLNVIVFGFAHAQKEATQTWIDPILKLKESNSSLSLFKVPVIDKKVGALRAMIRNGMRAGIGDDAARQRTLTLFVDKEKFAKAIGLTDDTKPATMLFDRAGKLLWRSAGESSEEKIAELSAVLALAGQH